MQKGVGIKQYIAGLALAWDLLKEPFQNHQKVSNWCPSEAERNDKGTNPSMVYLTEKDKELLKAMKKAKPVKPNLMPLHRPPAAAHHTIGMTIEYEDPIETDIRKKIKEIEQEERDGEYTTALKKIKELTTWVMHVYNGKDKQIRVDQNTELGLRYGIIIKGSKGRTIKDVKNRRKFLGILNSIATRIQYRMNKLDKDEPLQWKLPRIEKKLQVRKVTRSA